MMISLKDLSQKELTAAIKNIGEPAYRAEQIFEWLYHKGVTTFDEMTNLSLELRNKLKQVASLGTLNLVKTQQSTDGTIKYLFRLKDNQEIESVLIEKKERHTICISTQVGCKFDCLFCCTGKQGWQRNLSQFEILEQVLSIKRTNHFEPNKRINIVFMGMGEPLDNYEQVIKAIKTMTTESGMEISPKRITLSTCGLIPKLKLLAKEGLSIRLAISLNASSDETRTSIMPINVTYPLGELLETCRSYPLDKRSRITFEYIMLKGINDSEEDAKKLTRILKGFRCKINLIPYNGKNKKHLMPPSEKQISLFQNILKSKNYTTMIRQSKGADIMAACGQLGKNN